MKRPHHKAAPGPVAYPLLPNDPAEGIRWEDELQKWSARKNWAVSEIIATNNVSPGWVQVAVRMAPRRVSA